MDITLIAIFGLIIGSFLNVCIWRVPLKRSVRSPRRSLCTSCERQLTWWENIPVLSWVFLGAKCRTCKAPISGRYPLVEILSAIAAVGSVLRYEMTITALLVYALTATLIVITFIDIDHRIIPNAINFPGMGIGLAIGCISQFTDFFHYPITQGILDSVIGLLAGGGFFYVVGEIYYLVTKKEGLGGGDIKMLGMTGALLGWKSVAPTIFVGSFLGAVFGIAIMFFSGAKKNLEIAFGPWLALGVIIYMFTDLQLFRF